jgi:hypothetical protein
MVFRPVHLIGSVRIPENGSKRNTLSALYRRFWASTVLIRFTIGIDMRLYLFEGFPQENVGDALPRQLPLMVVEGTVEFRRLFTRRACTV